MAHSDVFVDSRDHVLPESEALSTKYAVIGAGFSGLCLAATFKRDGLLPSNSGLETMCILDKQDRVGGTWAENQYPGAACDVEAPLYTFSFKLNDDWSSPFAPHSEIQSYMSQSTRELGIEPYLMLKTTVLSATWSTISNRWVLSVSRESRDGTQVISSLTSRFVFVGCGTLSVPLYPNIPGLAEFPGALVHTARWDASLNVENKRVAVIGSAASAVQVVPKIQPKVSKLGVFQRTPNYIVPPLQERYSDSQRFTWSWIPGFYRLFRWYLFWRHEALMILPVSIFYQYEKSSMRDKFVRGQRARILEGMRSQCRPSPDQPRRLDIAKKCTPSYPIGCKRILQSSKFLPALCQDNVVLHTEGCVSVQGSTVHAGDGTKMEDVDCIVLATGFKAGSLGELVLNGENGEVLSDMDLVAKPVDVLYGISLENMPNLFLLYGPGSNLGHNSIIFMIECQANYISSIVQQCERAGPQPTVRVKQSALKQHNAWRRKAIQSTVWSADCPTWYKNANGEVPLNWPSSCTSYWWATLNPDCNALYDVEVSATVARQSTNQEGRKRQAGVSLPPARL